MTTLRIVPALALTMSFMGLCPLARQCQEVDEGKGIGGEIPVDAIVLKVQTDEATVLYTIYNGLDVRAQGLIAAGRTEEIDVIEHRGCSFFLLAFGDTVLCWESEGEGPTKTFIWSDPNTAGQLQVEVRITPQPDGRWKWEYAVTNLSYNPHRGNAFSAFQVFFADSVHELGGQFGPAGWALNSSVLGPKPPEGATWDRVVGSGARPGEQVIFGFITAPRVPVAFFGIAHTWSANIQDFIFRGELLVPGRPKS